MSATDELRRLLNERGAPYETLVTTWDYYNDEPKSNPVPPDGFCAWGERKKGLNNDSYN